MSSRSQPAIVDSFIFYRAKRYDVRGGRLLKLQEKYYAVDLGMRRAALSGRVRDNCPKTLITLDDADPIYHDGILQVNALDWLLGKAGA